MASAGGLPNTEEVRLGTQIFLIGRFVPYFGNLSFLEGLWAEVGNFTIHQDMFRGLDWSSKMITVCKLNVIRSVKQLESFKIMKRR